MIFGRDVWEIKPESPGKSEHYLRKTRIGNQHLYDPSQAGLLDLPIIEPYCGPLPRYLVPFHEIRCAVIHTGAFVYFFIDDYRFERLWTRPEAYLEPLKRFDGVIGTDFSQLAGMPYPQRLWNCYRNRHLGQWMQRNGINYIPNVTWSLPDSYDYSFSGMPRNSVIAINSNGITGTNCSKYLWYKGYEEALRHLKPSAIVRFGPRMPGENEAISVYFQNERLNLLKNGR